MSDAPLPAPPPRKRGRKPDPALRLHIMEVARDIIDEAGLDGLKARIVAKAAGTSVGTLYNTFGPIEDLVRLINADTCDALHAHQSAALEAARAESDDARLHLHALADGYLDWVGAHQRQWLATLSYNRKRAEAPPDWYAARERALLDIVADALTGFSAQMSDEARATAAFALWASIHGIVSMSVGDGFRLQDGAAIRAQMAVIIDAVAAQLEAG